MVQPLITIVGDLIVNTGKPIEGLLPEVTVASVNPILNQLLGIFGNRKQEIDVQGEQATGGDQ